MVQQSKGLGPAKLEASLVQRWIKIHAAEKRWLYTCLQTPEWEVHKKLRPWGRQFRRRKCDYVGCHFLRPRSSTGAYGRQPNGHSLQRWGLLPAMKFRREVFQRDNARSHTAVTRFDPNTTFVRWFGLTRVPWMGQNSARPYSSIDRVYAETDSCYVTGYGTTDIDFEVTSSERYGI